jgi:hypothetical protein
MGSQGINVGDAVLRFISDSSQLDTAFDQVGPKATAAFQPAAQAAENFGDAAEEAGERTQVSMREARGEVGLLGEAFGIRLPRHVRSFIAELPGVGEAMSAAFSATAILFVAQALVQATEKLSNFVGNTLIFTDEMRESNAAVAASNKSLEVLSTIYSSAKEKLAALNGETISWEETQRAAAQATITAAKAELAQMEAHIANKSGWEKAKDTMKDVANTIIGQVIPGYDSLSVSIKEQLALQEKQESVTTITAQAIKATSEVYREEAAKNAKMVIDNSLRELENQKRVALAYAQNDEEKYQLDQAFEEKKLALLNSYAVKDKAAIQALMSEIEAQQIQHADKISASFVKMLSIAADAQAHALDAVKASVVGNEIALTPLQAAYQKAKDAASLMGVTLRTDLVQGLEKAQKAEEAFARSGMVDAVALKAFQDEVARSQKALDTFGHSEEKFSIKSHGIFKQLQEDSKDGATALQGWKQIGTNALSDVTSSAQSAFSNLLLAQGSFGQALEKATEKILASVASQALIQGLFDVAKSFEAEAAFDYTGAAQYLTASEQMFAVAALAGGAAAGMARAGGGSSSSNTTQSHTSGSNTGQSNRSGGSLVGVQAFADGGLINAATIALVGERGREAVLPLDDPRAMSAIREGVGGGTTHHWHIEGMISPDNLSKVVKQIDKAVNKGQMNLTSSNSLRLTKRSA